MTTQTVRPQINTNWTHFPWIVNAKFDQLFLFGSWALPLVIVGLVMIHPPSVLAAILVLGLIDVAHLGATWPITFFDRKTMSKSQRYYVTMFILISSLSLLAAAMGPTTQKLWFSLVVFLSPPHIIGQHKGFLRLYQARSGRLEQVDRDLEIRVLYTGFIFALFHSIAYESLPFFELRLPHFVPWLSLIPFAAFTFQLLWRAVENGTGNRAFVLRFLYLFMAISNFWFGMFLGLKLGLPPSLIGGAFHGVQYLAIIWVVGKNRYSLPEEHGVSLVRPIFTSAFLFISCMLLLGVVVFALKGGMGYLGFPDARDALRDVWFYKYIQAFLVGLQYIHYMFDARTWKLRSDERMKRDLGIGKVQSTAVLTVGSSIKNVASA